MSRVKITCEEVQAARKLAWEAYAKAQADGEVPAWVVLNGGAFESRIGEGVWDVTGYLYKHHTLPPGIAWERRSDGRNELVSYNLETGEKMMLISYDVEDEVRLHFFDVEVDLSSRTVIVKESIAASQLRPEEFLLEYDNFDLTKTWRFDQSWEQNRLSLVGGKSG